MSEILTGMNEMKWNGLKWERNIEMLLMYLMHEKRECKQFQVANQIKIQEKGALGSSFILY